MAIAAVIVFWFIALQFVAGDPLHNVVQYGAVGDGISYDTQAFLRAWEAACADSSKSTLLIPSGMTFLLSRICFRGPCNSGIHVQVDGNIVAPNKLWTEEATNLITFEDVHNLTVDGDGEIDGQGSIWWSCAKKEGCQNRPNLLGFVRCDDVWLSGITLKNSPGKQMKINWSVRVLVKGINIEAPGSSPNTDGIYVSGSQLVEITDSTIGTGDDCISVGPGCSDVNITHITCGPGHGISIGSLGVNSMVERIHVSDSDISGTTTGVRIKTLQGGSGYAKEISFERINFTSVKTPIVIDQYYCPHQECHDEMTTNVAISDVRYVDLSGSSTKKEAIDIQCYENLPCQNIVMKDVTLYYDQGKGLETSICNNAYGRTERVVIPEIFFQHRTKWHMQPIK